MVDDKGNERDAEGNLIPIRPTIPRPAAAGRSDERSAAAPNDKRTSREPEPVPAPPQPAPPAARAETVHDDSFQVISDFAGDLSEFAAGLGEVFPKARPAAQKAQILGAVVAETAKTARNVTGEVKDFAHKGRIAVDRLEKRGIPVRDWLGKVFTTDTPLPDFPTDEQAAEAAKPRGEPSSGQVQAKRER
jgi:hypothetical protein